MMQSSSIQHLTLAQIRGNLITLKLTRAQPPPSYEEVVNIASPGRPLSLGRVVQVSGEYATILVFGGTNGLGLTATTTFTGEPLKMEVSEALLGRVFDGMGRPIDGLGPTPVGEARSIAGCAISPTNRIYPRNYIHTGFSAIDGLATLIRGQKLPIFSMEGLPHNRLAAEIATFASVAKGGKFAVVFAALGVTFDTADFFRNIFEESGQANRTIMYLNLANDPTTERIATPRFALTAAEYLAYDLGYHVLAIITDMTAYAEAIREISSANGEIPSRKGYPGYMYSDLASIYERAGIVKNSPGSLTQIPVLTMPGDDITHPIPDLTGFITEGQIVMCRRLARQGIWPPVNVLPSLSRLMKDGIGEGYTTAEHPAIAAAIFAKYAKVGDVRALASIVGEDELTIGERNFLIFGQRFEEDFVNQHGRRTLTDTLDIAAGLV